MDMFLMLSWPALIVVSYLGAVWALKKSGKL